MRAIDLNTSVFAHSRGGAGGRRPLAEAAGGNGAPLPAPPQALENTLKIAAECARRSSTSGSWCSRTSRLPGGSDVFEYLREECYRGAERRYGELSESVVKRLEHELAIIRDKGFAPYFLVVQDIVRQSARTCGRGSAAASLVSYCLGITARRADHAQPLLRALPQRGPCRIRPTSTSISPGTSGTTSSNTSFRKYGAGPGRDDLQSRRVPRARRASGKMAKVYGLPEAEIKAVTERMGYYWSMRNLPDVIRHDPVYKDMELKEPWPEIIRLAEKLEGYPRNMSVHCGGVVIVPDRIDRYVPVEPAPKGVPDHPVGERPGGGRRPGEDRPAGEPLSGRHPGCAGGSQGKLRRSTSSTSAGTRRRIPRRRS